MVRIVSIALTLAAASWAAQANDGLRTIPLNTGTSLGAETSTWTLRWQPPRSPDMSLSADAPARLSGAWKMLGDYHFSQTPGLRVTGGLLGLQELSARPELGRLVLLNGYRLPYVGLGYNASWPQPGLRGLGWALSADVGLLALTPRSAVRLGLDGSSGGVRLAPTMQFGLSYGF